MTGVVVDASIAVKWLVDEEYSDESVRLLDRGMALIAPELLFAEVANALWAMCRRGDITLDDLGESIDVLKAAPVLVPQSMQRLAPSAARLAVDLDHPVYDCFYLALAIQEQYRVVTADRRFHDRARRHPYLADRIEHIETVT